jgi:nucleoside-diphosphate-sugar epimerase
MRCAVTGAAGFIGSHLCERLLEQGHEVRGIDAIIPYYSPALKEQNLTGARIYPRFHFHQLDLRHDPLDAILADVDLVFHLAAMPGLSNSWTDFDGYWACNVQATHRLLELYRRCGAPRRIVCASSAAVYGRFAEGDETQPTHPVSPYGVTKLAGEHLCRSYTEAFGLPIVILRYFSVYGPRQRPDMGYHKFIKAMQRNEKLTVYGDGEQIRNNTYVSDCVAATEAAAEAVPGAVYNVGGGEAVSVWDVLGRLEKLSGRKAKVRREPARPGDQRNTRANTSKITAHLDWRPATSLDEGLALQWEWQAQGSIPAPRVVSMTL